MKIDLTQAIDRARVFLKDSGFETGIELDSAQQLFRIVANTKILGGKQREILIDLEGRVRYYGDVRDLIEVPEDRLKNPDIVEGLIEVSRQWAKSSSEDFEKRLRNFLAASHVGNPK